MYVTIGDADEDYVYGVEYGALVEAGPVATVVGDPAQVRVLGDRQEVQLTEEPEGERIREGRLKATKLEEHAAEGVEGRVGVAAAHVRVSDAEDDEREDAAEDG